MAVTVADVIRSGPPVVLVGGPDTVAISWVHSSDLVDPSPFLDAGQLLLVTGAHLLHRPPAEVVAYVGRLVAVGISALGFGVGVVVPTIPTSLVQACADQGLTLLEVPYATPFIAVSRWVAEALAAEANARDAWALRAQRAVSLAALSRGRTTAVLDELAGQLGAAVVLWDARSQLVSRHGPAGPDPEPEVRGEVARLLRRGLRAGSALDHDGTRTVLQTLGRRGELRGVLSVTAAGRLDPAANAVLTSATALTEFALEDVGRRRSGERAVRAQLLGLLLAGRRDLVGEVVGDDRLPVAPLRVLLADDVRATAVDLTGTLESLAEKGTALFVGARDGELVVLSADDDLPGVLAGVAAAGVPVGVSRRTDYPHLSSALVQARAALVQAREKEPVVYADAAADLVLGILPRAELAELARVRLTAVEAAADGSDLLRAVEVWLRHNAQWEPAARELGVHRHTVKAKVRRVGQLSGLPLDSFTGKAQLWMMLMAR